VEYCRAAGFNYRDMEEEDGVLLAVVEAQCRYLHPARYDDEVIVSTQVRKAGQRGVQFGYEMRRAADGRLLATGETKHLFCGRDLKPTRLPAKRHAQFGL
jgi:acyl-CoA thioester hydrolase